MTDDQRPETDAPPKRPKTRVRTAPTAPSGLTVKQEAFAQAVGRDGKSYSDAYREAYDAEGMAPGSVWTAASELGRHPAVSLRIEEIVQEIREEHSASEATRAARIIKTLEEMMLNAKTDSGRLRAAELLGKTVGLYRDVTENRDDQRPGVAELEARLQRIIERNRPPSSETPK